MNLALYIDGIEAQSVELEATLHVDDTTIGTIIGDPVRTASAPALPPPLILNTVLSATSPWTLDSFSDELCNTQ